MLFVVIWIYNNTGSEEIMFQKCCCVILNYNDSDTVIDLIDRIKNYSVFGKIILVDNYSTDNSVKELQTMTNDKIELIVTDRNGGYGYGNNYGIRYAKKLGYDYVVVSNPDVYFEEQMVINLLNEIKGDSKIAMITGKQLDINNNTIYDIAWKIPSIFEECIVMTKISYWMKLLHYPRRYFELKKCIVDCIPGAFFVANINNLISVGGYDENMFLFCEETVIGYKLKKADYLTILMPGEFYIHAHSVSIKKSISSEVKQRKMVAESRIYFLKTYLGANKMQILLAMFMHNWSIFIYAIKSKIRKQNKNGDKSNEKSNVGLWYKT